MLPPPILPRPQAQPRPILAGSPRPNFVGRTCRLWRRNDCAPPPGCPFEAVILDYIDSMIHVQDDDGRDYWIPVEVLATIEVTD